MLNLLDELNSKVFLLRFCRTSTKLQAVPNIIFVLRKKGSKTKERMKEEEIEKGDCGPRSPTKPKKKKKYLISPSR